MDERLPAASEQLLLQDDLEARQAALDVSRSFIVQAPAGSGKTELLIQRYLKLLGVVEHPEEVLAITFTVKAAAEMRNRVLQALRTAASGRPPEAAHLRLTFDTARQVLQADARFGWQLLSNPGRMRILTLDSLNAAIARMQPLTSSVSTSGAGIGSEVELRAVYREAAFLTLDQLVDSGPLHAATRTVLRHLDNNTQLYTDYLSRMLATRDQWLPFIGSGTLNEREASELRVAFEHALQTAVISELRQLQDLLPADTRQSLLTLGRYGARTLRDAGSGDHPIARLAECDQFGAAAATDAVYWQALAELLLTKEGQWRKRINKTVGFPPEDDGERAALLELLEVLTPLDGLREALHHSRLLPAARYSDEQWQVLLALFRLLPLAVTELRRLFGERNLCDYIEVAFAAAAALGTVDKPGDVALLLDYQLRHLLVDEMQDTAAAQYQMLAALTGGWENGDGRTLFCVGDPMQSIYRFRNAEVGEFLLAQQRGIGLIQLENLALRRNFRSGEHLVNWYNTVFPDVLAARDEPAKGAVSYAPAVSIPEQQGFGEVRTWPLFGNDVQAEAVAGRQVVQRVLAQQPDEDMAILVRSRTHLAPLLAQLRNAGIAYSAIEIDRLTDLPEIIDALAITRVLSHRGDRLAWLALLRSPLVGLDWQDLHTLVVGESTRATVWELLETRVTQLSEAGQTAVSAMLAILGPALRMSRTHGLRDRVERLWFELGGPAVLQTDAQTDNVYQFFDVLEQLEAGGGLVDIATLETALDVEHVSNDIDARLQVMTMHKAKGLQFDHVLLYGLGHAPGQHQRSVLSWFDLASADAAAGKVLGPVGPRGEAERDPIHQFIESVETRKSRHELGRLLYVACTRAKRSLHLLGHVRLQKDAKGFLPPASNTLLWLLWPTVNAEFTRAFAHTDASSDPQAADPWRLPQLRRFAAGWHLPTFAAPGAAIEPAEIEQDDPVEFYWVGSDARTAGTVTHHWLQFFAANPDFCTAPDFAAIRASNTRWLAQAGISGTAATAINERVISALESTLADERGRWLLGGKGAAELAISGVVDGDVESVVLDRVRIDDDGTHWIVDYKTGAHEGGNLDDFIAAEVRRYAPQLAKYQSLYRALTAADVRAALYFPLLQRFVEVPL